MADIRQSDEKVKALILSAENEIQTVESTPFSPNAYSILRMKISEYISNLVDESIKVSKRHQADTVSSAHVRRASEYLVSSTSRQLFRHLGTVGGILLGASISAILTMVTEGRFTSFSIIASVLFGIIGAFLIALQIAKD
jgi:hypothetical protein